MSTELPPPYKLRILDAMEVETSIHNWMRIADILEVHADEELREGASEMKPGFEFGRQMAQQIRENVIHELGGEVA